MKGSRDGVGRVRPHPARAGVSRRVGSMPVCRPLTPWKRQQKLTPGPFFFFLIFHLFIDLLTSTHQTVEDIEIQMASETQLLFPGLPAKF